MKSHADAAVRVAVNNIRFHHDVVACQWNSQRERRPYWNLTLRGHVETAQANVLGAGNASRVHALEIHIENKP